MEWNIFTKISDFNESDFRELFEQAVQMEIDYHKNDKYPTMWGT